MRSGYRFSSGWPRRIVEAIPVDLAVVVLLAFAADVAVLVDAAPPIRAIAVLPLLFFLPGYAIVASLYPAGAREPTRAYEHGIGLVARLALSFGVSLVVVPLVAVAVLAVGGTGPSSVAYGLFGIVLVGATVGAVRRRYLPPDQRFRLPYRRWRRSLREAFGRSTPPMGRLLNVFVAVSVLVAVASLGFALVSPPAGGEVYTGVTLLSENEDGELATAGELAFSAGDPEELALEITNQEGETTTYTVVIQLERVTPSDDGFAVAEREELDRLTVEVGDGGTRTVTHELAPSMTGDDLRLSYYVYRGDAPATPDEESAYRHLYAWTTVEAT